MTKEQKEKYDKYQNGYHSKPENRAKALLRTKEWRRKNPERVEEYSEEYRKNNPEKIRAWNRKNTRKWRAKIKKNKGNK